MNLSIIITAKEEPSTVGLLIEALENDLAQVEHQVEVLLVCPDEQTKQAGLENDRMDIVSWLKDKGKGKPAALNQAFAQAQGEYLVLTDGDVIWEKGALKKLISKFRLSSRPQWRDPSLFLKRDSSANARNDKEIGLVTGQPVSLNSRNNILGFWSHFLTFAADNQRRKRQERGEYFDASGYLLAVKKELVEPMPKNTLVDDAYLSHLVWDKNKKIKYASRAKIKVKFPTNFSDWVKQKKRTLSGYIQLKQLGIIGKNKSTRSFRQEIKGLKLIFSYPENLREFWWLILLLLGRLYVWLLVFKDRIVLKKDYFGNWERIESTK